MCDGRQPACNRGNGGQSRYTLSPLGASGGGLAQRHQAQIPQASFLTTPSHPGRCQARMQLTSTSVWQMATHLVPDPIGSSRRTSFSGEPDPVPEPARKCTACCLLESWTCLNSTEPLMCVADPGRQTRLTLAIAGAGVRLSLL